MLADVFASTSLYSQYIYIYIEFFMCINLLSFDIKKYKSHLGPIEGRDRERTRKKGGRRRTARGEGHVRVMNSAYLISRVFIDVMFLGLT